jgi:hypothetical protein
MKKETRDELLKLLWETELDIIPVCSNDIFCDKASHSTGDIYKVEVGDCWEYNDKIFDDYSMLFDKVSCYADLEDDRDIEDFIKELPCKKVIYLHIGT